MNQCELLMQDFIVGINRLIRVFAISCFLSVLHVTNLYVINTSTVNAVTTDLCDKNLNVINTVTVNAVTTDLENTLGWSGTRIVCCYQLFIVCYGQVGICLFVTTDQNTWSSNQAITRAVIDHVVGGWLARQIVLLLHVWCWWRMQLSICFCVIEVLGLCFLYVLLTAVTLLIIQREGRRIEIWQRV